MPAEEDDPPHVTPLFAWTSESHEDEEGSGPQIDEALERDLLHEAEQAVAHLASYPERAVEDWADEEARIQKWVAFLAQKLEVREYRVTYDEGREGGSPAYWDQRTTEIRIHRASWAANWSDHERMEVIAHEIFHAHQWSFWMRNLAGKNADGDRARRWNPVSCPRAPEGQVQGPDDLEGRNAYVAYAGHPFERGAAEFGRGFADEMERAGKAW